jgi:hypothetical protein
MTVSATSNLAAPRVGGRGRASGSAGDEAGDEVGAARERGPAKDPGQQRLRQPFWPERRLAIGRRVI